MDFLLTTLFSKPHIQGKEPLTVFTELTSALMLHIDRAGVLVRDLELQAVEIKLPDLKTSDLKVQSLSVASNANGRIEILPLPNPTNSYSFVTEQQIDNASKTPPLAHACLRVTQHAVYVAAWDESSAFYLSEPLTLEDLQRAADELDQRRADRMEAEGEESIPMHAETYVLSGPDMQTSIITDRDFN